MIFKLSVKNQLNRQLGYTQLSLVKERLDIRQCMVVVFFCLVRNIDRENYVLIDILLHYYIRNDEKAFEMLHTCLWHICICKLKMASCCTKWCKLTSLQQTDRLFDRKSTLLFYIIKTSTASFVFYQCSFKMFHSSRPGTRGKHICRE